MVEVKTVESGTTFQHAYAPLVLSYWILPVLLACSFACIVVAGNSGFFSLRVMCSYGAVCTHNVLETVS